MPKSSKTKDIKEPRVPTNLTYRTSSYERFNPQIHQNLSTIPSSKYFKFSDYDDCPLYMENVIPDVRKIPTGVRLDDLAIAHVLTSTLTQAELSKNWPSEFDQKGMPRATRLPLGYAAKIKVEAGDRDCNGNVARFSDQGWYYAWWKGLHPLLGEEGFCEYMIRPSHESFKAEGLTWFLHSKCEIQLPPGQEVDSTSTENEARVAVIQPTIQEVTKKIEDLVKASVAKSLDTAIETAIAEAVKRTVAELGINQATEEA